MLEVVLILSLLTLVVVIAASVVDLVRDFRSKDEPQNEPGDWWKRGEKPPEWLRDSDGDHIKEPSPM